MFPYLWVMANLMSLSPASMGTIAIATTVVHAMPNPAIRVGTPNGKPKPSRTANNVHNSREELHRGLTQDLSKASNCSSFI
jgi:hypothetical protein